MNLTATDNTQENPSQTLDGDVIEMKPTPSIHLKSIDDVRLEMAKVYRDMKLQRIATSDGTRLVYVLGQIGKMIELHELEKRIEKLEGKL